MSDNSNTDKKYLHQIQLTSHIVGAKSWDPYCRAKYLYYLSQTGDWMLIMKI